MADDGTVLATVELRGPNAYTFTGEVLAWGARELVGAGPERVGAVGPVEAFGLDRLRDGCAEIGLTRTI